MANCIVRAGVVALVGICLAVAPAAGMETKRTADLPWPLPSNKPPTARFELRDPSANPVLAASLGLGTSLAIGWAGFSQWPRVASPLPYHYDFVWAALPYTAAPIGLTAGYAYKGDPVRGLVVGGSGALLSTAVLSGAFAASDWIARTVPARHGPDDIDTGHTFTVLLLSAPILAIGTLASAAIASGTLAYGTLDLAIAPTEATPAYEPR